jgi:large subunit ribosomal protein L10
MSEYVTKVNAGKREAVQAIKDSFEGVNDFIFADYRGLTVEQITELRTKLRELNAEFHVIKNNFAKIAFRDLEYPEVDEYLVGPTAVAMARDESGPVAKELFKLAKDWPLEIKGGLVNGNVFGQTDMDAYSKLPTRLELIAKLMGTMNAPVQNLVFGLNGISTKLVRTLQAVADQKAEG